MIFAYRWKSRNAYTEDQDKPQSKQYGPGLAYWKEAD